MAKKQYFLILDTETTITDKVYDFGALVADRNGNIVQQCAIIIKDNLGDDLFYDKSGKAGGFWSRQNAEIKKQKYADMLNNGSRMLASANAVNRWLEKAAAKYNPHLTAYNLGFDRSKCANSGIDLTMFSQSFCLWHLACATWANTKAFKNFIAQNHYFGDRTEKGNMVYKTNAEIMAHFITGEYSEEPHTAIEDAQFFELPILVAALKKKNWKDKLGYAYNWRDYILRDHFVAK